VNKKNLDRLISNALQIEEEAAKEAGALGFIARSLVQATMPHSRPQGNEFTRKNGAYSVTMLSPSSIGLPYGTIPRLLLIWLTTEATRTQKREIVLGDNLNEFMHQLGLTPTGGRWGSITRLKDQMTRLFSTSISCTYDDGKHWAIKDVKPIEQANLWWEPKNPNQTSLWQSTITLGQPFFDEITKSPVPIDMRALKALRKSPMAIDIYCWLTYRISYLKRNVVIPWEALQMQFGANYTLDAHGLRNFKAAFLKQLRKVVTVYADCKVEGAEQGLLLSPSKTHILPVRENLKLS
jgi:hypothetical protein